MKKDDFVFKELEHTWRYYLDRGAYQRKLFVLWCDTATEPEAPWCVQYRRVILKIVQDEALRVNLYAEQLEYAREKGVA